MDTSVTIIPRVFRTYLVADIAARNALIGMRLNELCFVEEDANVYRYSGSAWALFIPSGKFIWVENAVTLTLSNQSSTVAWTTRTIASGSYQYAKLLMVQVKIHIDSYVDGDIDLLFREIGGTPAVPATVHITTPTAGKTYWTTLLIPTDGCSGYQYNLVIGGTAQVDVDVYIIGIII